MSANKSNKCPTPFVPKFDNQSIVISPDIKNYPIVCDDACIYIGSLNISWGFPIRVLSRVIPSFKVLFAI